MTDKESFTMEPDPVLGDALRSALAPHHEAAFLTRMRTRLAQAARPRRWDDVLAQWFWRGLATATAAMAIAVFSLSQEPAADRGTLQIEEVAELSPATQILEGDLPGADVLFLAMQDPR